VELTTLDLGDNLYQIDAGMHGEPQRLACYLFDTPRRVLVECGPSVSMHHLVDALADLGVDDLAAIVVTHIHLDHAGGAGHMAQRFPGAQIGVHEVGARHLVDPTRLWRSATRVYGEDGMDTLWGPMEPIEESRVLVLDDGDSVDLGGGRSLDVLYTPGHAKHHIVFLDQATGGCFVGDAVGIAFPHGHFTQPVTPPPDFDPDLVVSQLRRIGSLQPDFLGFAHFGIDREPAARLSEAEDRLTSWVTKVEALGEREDAIEEFRRWVLDGYRADGHAETVIATYDANTYWPMQLSGIRRWLSEHKKD
jgi:glyoxylase-like metal-dependent hydrolase (beta-lactamase superfamily II)